MFAVSDWNNPNQLAVKYNANDQVTSFIRPGSNFSANNPALFGEGNVIPDNNANDMIVRGGDRLTVTQAFGLNSKWKLSPELRLEADLASSRSTSTTPDMFMVNGILPKGGDVLTYGSTPTLVFGDSITDPTSVLAHAVGNGEAHNRDALHEGRLNLSWDHEIGYFKGVDTGLAYSILEVKRTRWNSDSLNAFSGYHLPLPASLFTVKQLDNFYNGAPSSYLSYDPVAYTAYLNQPSNLPGSNDPALYANLAKYPNGPMAIDYTTPAMWAVKEKVTSVFLDTKWEGAGWSADAGLRMVQVRSTSSGISRILLSAVKSPNDGTFISNWGPSTANSVSQSYHSVLPSANIKFDLTDDMVLRLGASKTETRPTMSQMGVDNYYGGRFGDVQTGGGNPNLKPMESKNLDLSYEW